MKTLPIPVAMTAAFSSFAVSPQADKAAEGLELQKARSSTMQERGKKTYYTKKWDLTDLPSYQPKQRVKGTIRMWGSNYIADGNLGKFWEDAFHKFHPGVKFDYHLKTTVAAVPSLVFCVSDVGVGRKLTFHELLLFQRYFDRDPVEISVATGSYDVPGWNPAFGIVVHKDNPLTQLTMEQLDGIFGAERLGGWDGTSWHPEYARGPEKNVRTWGELGLTGEWKDKEINVYGLNLRYHQATEGSDRILRGSDKWKEGGPYVAYAIDTVRDRTYPFFDEIYMYVDSPGGKIDPKVREFLRFVVSREGQAEVMRDAKYLPLTATLAREQLKKLQ